MTEKRTRGKSSKVDQLPEPIKNAFIALLRDKKHSQLEILSHVNELIEEAGLPDDYKLSRAGVNRYATGMETVGAKIREAKEVSNQWVAQLGSEPEGEVSKILIEMVRTLAFDQVLKLSESGAAVEPKYIRQLAQGVKDLEDAATKSHKREQEIKKAFAEEKMKEMEDLRGADGMSEQLENKIRDILLGKQS